MAAILESDFDVLVWSTSEDGPVDDELFTGVSLVIWASGDYRREEGDTDDLEPLINFFFGGGTLVYVGATPPFLEGVAELSVLSDVQVAEEPNTLTEGLTPGDVSPLDQSYDIFQLADVGDSTVFLVQGPGSSQPGAPVGYGFEYEFDDSFEVALMVPFDALPAEVGETLLANIVTFVGLEP
jgi:hypothetical protein